jgi:hypothetical protein
MQTEHRIEPKGVNTVSLTPEQKIERLWDTEQCRKLMAKYEYYAFCRTWENVPGMFAERDDIWIDCEGFGVFDGARGVRTFFVDWHHSMEGDARGMMTLHTLSTECIEVAEDGKTAHGLWISPGCETRRHATEDRNEAFWIWGLYAIDFIKEEGEWKFWHFRIPHLIVCDYHHSWVDLDGRVMGSDIGNDGRPDADRPNTFPPTFYGGEKKPTDFFEPPRPYRTEADLRGFWEMKD